MSPADRPIANAPPTVYRRYIPNALLEIDPLIEHSADWWVGKLLDYREPPLLERASGPEAHAYRILTLPSLSVAGDSVVTVERRPEGAVLQSKASVRCTDYQGDGIATAVETRPFAEESWLTLSRCMDEAFWRAPFSDSVIGVDGVTTVIEGVREGSYHVIYRWSLDYDDRDAERRTLLGCVAMVERAAGRSSWYARAP